MKKIAIISLVIRAICISGFAISADFLISSESSENFSQNLKVVSIWNLTDADLNEIMQGQHPDTAVKFSAQTVLPISFLLKGDLVNLIENEGRFGAVEIQQTFYARYVNDDLILSTNLVDWKPFLEFITGNTFVALTIQDGQPSLVFGSETNRRL